MKRRMIQWLWIAALTALVGFMSVANAEESKGITNPYDGRADLIPKGKTLFNVHCSHCHGPNAVQGERKRDLRRLSRRYKDRYACRFLPDRHNGPHHQGHALLERDLER